MTATAHPVERLRARVGDALFTRIAGPGGYEARDRIHNTPGPRWFPRGSAIRRVQGDASNFVGGLRSLLLQSLHPLAMAGVAGHSGYRGDPWGRLARTSTFLAYTTYGTSDHAQEMIDRVRAIHERIRGTTEDGQAYRASDPHLLLWVHVAEADSFLSAYERYGDRPLGPRQADEYVAQSGRVAEALGALNVPQTKAELAACLEAYRPELRVTPAALDTTHFLLHEPPLPWALRGPYGLVSAGAVASLPAWARDSLNINTRTNRVIGGTCGAIATTGVRWGLGSAEPPQGR